MKHCGCGLVRKCECGEGSELWWVWPGEDAKCIMGVAR